MMSYHGNKTNFVMHEYHIGSFRGYGAKMDDKYVSHFVPCDSYVNPFLTDYRLREIVRSMKNVKYIECSQV